MSQLQIDTELHIVKERIKFKINFASELISSAQNDLTQTVNRVRGRRENYCDHALLLRQEYGCCYNPGLDLVDILNSRS